jgi:hypothetical protein
MESQESIQKQLAKKRGEILDITDELTWLAEAPLVREEVKRRVESAIDALAAEFDGNPSVLANPESKVCDLMQMLTLPVGVYQKGDSGFGSGAIKLGPLLAWLFGDTIRQRLHAAIDQLDYRPGPAMIERPERIKALQEKLRGLEVDEEDLIVAAEALGVSIARRADVDPAVILAFDPSGKNDDMALRRAIAPSWPSGTKIPAATPLGGNATVT